MIGAPRDLNVPTSGVVKSSKARFPDVTDRVLAVSFETKVLRQIDTKASRVLGKALRLLPLIRIAHSEIRRSLHSSEIVRCRDVVDQSARRLNSRLKRPPILSTLTRLADGLGPKAVALRLLHKRLAPT